MGMGGGILSLASTVRDDSVAGSGGSVSYVSPCASLAWGLLLLFFTDDLPLWLPWGDALCLSVCLGLLRASEAKSTCPLLLLGAVCCRPCTFFSTFTTVHFQVTNSLTHTHSAKTY
ncbi:hypothetical protein ATANTOWER_008109 [Ataeniobius toweri]|uniref:Secreted protein n=1 Tax=Ataeniobius toweri TaxID=208326 RepID=A0ABU7BC84_9TELE|nr:hypothetical protein [Ataeniobius toweri]